MKEIKFRGKRIDNSEWVYGQLTYKKCVRDNGMPEIYFDWVEEIYAYIYEDNLENNIEEYPTKFVEVIPETIGQYTGLKDKNGVEVFEGDIVMFDYEWTKPNETGVITWNNENASFQIKGHIPSSSMKHLYKMKVIGNIYDDKGSK